jgi:hypothetical protein
MSVFCFPATSDDVLLQNCYGTRLVGRGEQEEFTFFCTLHLAPKYPNLMLRKRVDYTRQNFDYDATKLAF